jgi:Flp pilus assembly protein TadD
MGRNPGSVMRALAVVVAAGLPLAACGTSDLGGISVWGDNQLKPAEISDIGTYPADRALTQARAHFRNNDFGYSATLYKRYVEIEPTDPQGYIGLSASYDRLRRFDLSDRVYAAWYAMSGGTAQYYNNLGYSYLLRGDLSVALVNLKKAKQLDPGNPVVANNLRLLADVSAGRKAPPRA